jgi:3-deoxy-manno-octulosonate cytidylyltransferase (CMP-KDO synthetase)
VQGDEPLIDTGAVDALIERLAESGATIATLACPLETEQELHSRDVVKVVLDLEGNALYFSRAAIGSLNGALRHVGVYAYRRTALEAIVSLPQSPLEKAESLEQLRAMQHGFRIVVSHTSKPHLGVDRPEDVATVERELARQRSQ